MEKIGIIIRRSKHGQSVAKDLQQLKAPLSVFNSSKRAQTDAHLRSPPLSQAEIRLKTLNMNNLSIMSGYFPFRGYLPCATGARAACAPQCARLLGGCAQRVRPWLTMHAHVRADKNKKYQSREEARPRATFRVLGERRTAGVRWCDAAAGGIILRRRFPGDGEID